MYFSIDGKVDGYEVWGFDFTHNQCMGVFPDINELVEWVKEQVSKLRWCCPDCSDVYGECPTILEYDIFSDTWTCPECGCTTSYPEDDMCWSLDY